MFLNYYKKNKGFTLIELLVVIAIIGLLAALSVVSLMSARNQARRVRAENDLKYIREAIIMAQGETGKTLLGITSNGCSYCACPRTESSINIATSSSCYKSWIAALSSISDASNGLYLNLENLDRDPWGSPYGLDENEGEGGNCSRTDTLRSFGPDGKVSGDDVHIFLPASGFCN